MTRALARVPLEAGNTLYREGRLAEAAARYREALEADPSYAEARYNLGCATRALSGPAEALHHFLKAVSLKPEWGEARYNLGCALAQAGRLPEALPHLEHAARLKPLDPGVRNNLGLTLSLLDREKEALCAFYEALRLDPEYAEVHNNLAILHQHFGRIGEAIASLGEALRLRPHYPEALNNLACALKAQGRIEEALPFHRQALVLNPELTEAHSSLLFALNYSDRVGAEEIFSEHRAFGERYRRPVTRHQNVPDPLRRLRIGYLSADFKDHAVSRFLEPVLKNHDRKSFEIFCYSNVASPDQRTWRMRGLTDGWREIRGVSDETVERVIREDGIDILIDLSGHTAGNRLTLFARKPAPLQVTWIGYPQTTGVDAIDYRITDAVADPPGRTERLHVEELLRLPRTFSCFAPPHDTPPVGELPALKCGTVTFGSFNNPAKISASTVSLWSSVLRALPASRMLIKGYSLADRESRARLASLFEAQGIPAVRLTMRGNTVSYAEHLELYESVDVALDTFPYHGTTTTCEALWMGVPVVTLAGSEHRSRVGASILTSVGLPELVAASPQEYQAAALTLASDLPRLSALRGALRGMMAQAPVTDGAGFTRELEEALRKIWIDWCASQAAIGASLLAEEGERMLAAGRLDQALFLFSAALKSDPQLAAALGGMARVLDRQLEEDLSLAGRGEALKAEGAPAPRQCGATAQTLKEAAAILLSRGMVTPCALLCHYLIDRGEGDGEVQHLLGDVGRELGADAAAAEFFEKARRLGDDSTATRIAQLKSREGARCKEKGAAHQRHLVIKAWGYGFWSDVSHVLGGLLLAEMTGRAPLVHWGGNSLFGDDPAANAFEAFFEPVGTASLVELAFRDRSFFPPKWHARNLLEDRVETWEGAQGRFSALRALERTEDVVVSDFHFSVHDLVPWITPGHWLYGLGTDEVCRALFARYLKVRPEILAETEDFYRSRMAGRTLLGVHVRGGDKGGEDPNLVRINALYSPYLSRFLQRNPEGALFLITDDDKALERYRREFGDRVICGEATRTATTEGVHYQKAGSRERLGVEVLRDVLLALRCQSFVGYGFSNVSCAVAQLKEWSPGALTLFGVRMDRQRRFTMYRS